MMRFLHRHSFLVPLALAVLVLALGWFIHSRVQNRLQAELANELTTIRDSNAAVVREWFTVQERIASGVAEDLEVIEAATPLIRRGPQSQDTRRTDYLKRELERLLRPVVLRNDFSSYLLTQGERIVLSSDPALGEQLPASLVETVRHLELGQAWTSPPLLDASNPERPATPRMWVCSPLPVGSPNDRGLLCFVLDPRRTLARSLPLTRFRRTGETYAFDGHGLLISPSRFEGDLRRSGLLGPDQSSMFRIEIRDPGQPLTTERPVTLPGERPFTRMARAALRGEDGVDVNGYIGYRGVPVVGAWVWLGRHRLGVATEIDEKDAYETLRIIHTSMWVLFSIALLATLGLAFGARVIRRLERTARRAEKLGQYTLEERIGEGGMGTVYRARHALLRRPTALKVIRSVELDSMTRVRFEREVQATAQLTHPNTVAIYDYGRAAGGIFYYAMEYLDGITLQTLVRTDGPQPQARVMHILQQVCGSLAEAHANGLVHRDIKPANIMLCQRGGMYDVVKVLDFGLVKQIDSNEPLLTAANTLAGTPHYMAPEYITEPRVADARSDVYAVAAVAFYLLTARLLFDGGNMVSVLTRHMTEPPPRPSTVSPYPVDPAFEALLLTCLDKDPAARPDDAGSLFEKLENLQLALDMRWTQREAQTWWQTKGRTLLPEPRAPFTTAPTLAVDLRGRFGAQRGAHKGKERRRRRDSQEPTLPTKDVRRPPSPGGDREHPA